MDDKQFGVLLTPDIKIHRNYFKQMVKLIGIQVIYKSPKSDKDYTRYNEIKSNYTEGQLEGCIFDEHPTQQTLKKIGWVSELQENSSIISVRYDLENLQQGSLFIIPSGLDDGKGRVFRVVKMSTIMLYPASITCEIVPEYEDTFNTAQQNFEHSDFTLLNHEEGY